jgi:Tol biopolymer transport system component
MAFASAVLLAAAAIAILPLLRRPPSSSQVVRFSIPVPAEASFALSPDGTQLAYTTRDRLWLRPLDALSAHELAGTEGATFPFWSPDSRSIAFGSDGKLKTINASGGPAQTLCDAPRFTGGAWSPQGVILFGDGPVIYRVSATGGAKNRLTLLDGTRQASPQLLPGARRFLFTGISASSEKSGVYAASIDDPRTPTLVLRGIRAEAYAEDYLVAIGDNALTAYPFDVARLKIRGDGLPLRFAEQAGSLSVAGKVLAYRGVPDSRVEMLWFDRSGKILGPTGEPAEAGPLALSPDGKTAVVVRNGSVWLLDITRGTNMRLTFGNGEASSAVWSPDGTRILFGSHEATGGSLFAKAANSSAGPDLILKTDGLTAADSWSMDGRFILYDVEDGSGKSAIWELPLAGDKKPMPVVQGDFRVRSARLSPDGKWLAYVSNESGRDEVYVQGVPPPARKWAISAGGGMEPAWRENGQELFFLSGDGMLMATEMKATAEVLLPGIPRPLFGARGANHFAATADGNRFLVQASPQERESDSINVVLNWPMDLRR